MAVLELSKRDNPNLWIEMHNGYFTSTQLETLAQDLSFVRRLQITNQVEIFMLWSATIVGSNGQPMTKKRERFNHGFPHIKSNWRLILKPEVNVQRPSDLYQPGNLVSTTSSQDFYLGRKDPWKEDMLMTVVVDLWRPAPRKRMILYIKNLTDEELKKGE